MLLCSSETWTTLKTQENILLSLEAWCWRRLQNVGGNTRQISIQNSSKTKEFIDQFEKKNKSNMMCTEILKQKT